MANLNEYDTLSKICNDIENDCKEEGKKKAESDFKEFNKNVEKIRNEAYQTRFIELLDNGPPPPTDNESEKATEFLGISVRRLITNNSTTNQTRRVEQRLNYGPLYHTIPVQQYGINISIDEFKRYIERNSPLWKCKKGWNARSYCRGAMISNGKLTIQGVSITINTKLTIEKFIKRLWTLFTIDDITSSDIVDKYRNNPTLTNITSASSLYGHKFYVRCSDNESILLKEIVYLLELPQYKCEGSFVVTFNPSVGTKRKRSAISSSKYTVNLTK